MRVSAPATAVLPPADAVQANYALVAPERGRSRPEASALLSSTIGALESLWAAFQFNCLGVDTGLTYANTALSWDEG